MISSDYNESDIHSVASEPVVAYQQGDSVSISIESVWHIIEALKLTVRQKQTLIQRLMQSLIPEIEQAKDEKSYTFPKIPKDFKISKKTHDNVIGKLPEGVDFEKETEKMWEELAK